ncbi:MAG: hypothetical protein HYX53_07775 [Chloroflexi bacterium]|nr:hypothetical protein [Chloroflexota bacterium]
MLMIVVLTGMVAGTLTSLALPVSANLTFGSHVELYTYDGISGSSCTGGRVDPISVLFYSNASTSNVNTHAGHHGGWTWSDGSNQYFYDHLCAPLDSQRASNYSFLGTSRYHMRYHWNVDNPNFGTYSIATPHYETIKLCGGIPKHAVSPTGGGDPGGFVKGKWDIGYNWHNWNGAYGGSPGPHRFDQSAVWSNTQAMQQCDGTYAWNDGWVDYVEII